MSFSDDNYGDERESCTSVDEINNLASEFLWVGDLFNPIVHEFYEYSSSV